MSRPIPAELLGGPGDGRFVEVDADNLLAVLEFPCLNDADVFGRVAYELTEWGPAGARYRYVSPETQESE